jgi:hypothetical protein
MKRHRGQPLPLEKKLHIVGELLQNERSEKRHEATRDDESDRHRTTLFRRTVDSKLIIDNWQ